MSPDVKYWVLDYVAIQKNKNCAYMYTLRRVKAMCPALFGEIDLTTYSEGGVVVMDARAQGPSAADRPAKCPDAGLALISDVCAKVTPSIPANVAVTALIDAAWSSKLDQRQQIMVMRIRQAIQLELPQTFAEAQAVSITDDEKLDFRENFSRKTRCWQRLFKIPDEKVIIHDESSVRLRPFAPFPKPTTAHRKQLHFRWCPPGGWFSHFFFSRTRRSQPQKATPSP